MRYAPWVMVAALLGGVDDDRDDDERRNSSPPPLLAPRGDDDGRELPPVPLPPDDRFGQRRDDAFDPRRDDRFGEPREGRFDPPPPEPEHGRLEQAAAGVIELFPPQFRALSGLDPDVLDGTTIRFQPGQCSSAEGRFLLRVEEAIDVDVRRFGLAGRSERQIVPGDVFFYVVGNSRTGEVSIRASQSNRYETYLLPEGWDAMRKLPFALRFDPDNFGGFPAMHCTGWPGRPTVHLTFAGSGAPWTAFAGSTQDQWTTIDLSPWMPDSARVAEVLCEVRYVGGREGSAFLRSTGAGVPRLVGSGTPTSSHGVCHLPIRVTSQRQLEVRTTGDVQFFIHVVGYEMTEPS